MVRKTKYKSVGVNDDTYEMIVELAKREKRNISQQLAMIVEQEFHKTFKEEISFGINDLGPHTVTLAPNFW